MRIFIQPTEALLFRTGHPFNAGENTYAETLFPPTPETLQGAVRATIAAHWDPEKSLAEAFQQEELVELIGNREHYGRFCITGCTLGRRRVEAGAGTPVERLFPMPAHLWHEEEGERRQLRLKPAPAAHVTTNLPDDMYLLYPEHPTANKLEAMQGWLTETGLQTTLHTQEEITAEDIVQSNELYVNEMRIGIGIDGATKTTAEGMLFQTHMVRMNADAGAPFVYGFVVDIRLLTAIPRSNVNSTQQFLADEQTQHLLRLPASGWLLLGGERRAAYFEVVAPASVVYDSKQADIGNLLYFATPAALARGWQPAAWPPTLSRPVAIATERYQSIGGWQLTPGSGGGRSKITRRCIPAGSVYFFRSPSQMPPFLTDYGWQIGYGIVHTGEYRP
ncbi:MAG TPA: type III-B CRISPR module-associated Cmr3 family protein [Ktedonobacteraceae bacterium]|nr:type III-B CRISPR module-associated Cmr3 family protein [Ktedonobacteraceae bacterium]